MAQEDHPLPQIIEMPPPLHIVDGLPPSTAAEIPPGEFLLTVIGIKYTMFSYYKVNIQLWALKQKKLPIGIIIGK